MRINNNITAKKTYGALINAGIVTQKSITKLSTGLRINKAADDAAGLGISEAMKGQIRGLEQSSHNVQDGISLVQTMDGALQVTQNILQRMRELSVQSANGTYSDNDRQNIQTEVAQLKQEIDQVAQTTNFNNISLLNGAGGSVSIDFAAAQKSTIAADFKAYNLTLIGSSLFASGNDGTSAIIYKSTDGGNNWTALPQTDLTTANIFNVTGDGVQMMTSSTTTGKFFSTSDGGYSWADITSNIRSANPNCDISLVCNYNNNTYYITAMEAASKKAMVFSSSDNGSNWTCTSMDTVAVSGKFSPFSNIAINGNTYVSQVGNTLYTSINRGVTWTRVSDLSNNSIGNPALIYGANNFWLVDASGKVQKSADGLTWSTVKTGVKKASLTTNGSAVLLAQDTGSDITTYSTTDGESWNESTITGAGTGIYSPCMAAVGDRFVVEGMVGSDAYYADAAGGSSKISLQVGANSGQTIDIDTVNATTTGIGVNSIDVSTQAGAQAAITAVDNAINTISQKRSGVGATQNRLEYVLSNINQSKVNQTSAESRIADVDMAQESVSYAKNNVLQQAATAMLSQADQQSQQILKLLP